MFPIYGGLVLVAIGVRDANAYPGPGRHHHQTGRCCCLTIGDEHLPRRRSRSPALLGTLATASYLNAQRHYHGGRGPLQAPERLCDAAKRHVTYTDIK